MGHLGSVGHLWDICGTLDYKLKVAAMMSVQFNQNKVVNGSEGEFKSPPKLKKNK